MQLVDVTTAQALRSRVDLEPIDAPDGRVFPPTYPPAEQGGRDQAGPRHVVETLPDGSLRVLIDSVASQANRQEAALVAARDAGVIDFADIVVELGDTEAGIERLSATEMPHRLSDAILRDSTIDGADFAKSALGKQILATTPNDLSILLQTSPTTLLYGCWFSQHNLARPLKLQRLTTCEIWAHNAVLGRAVGSRIDPLGIEKLQLYETADGDWTAAEAKAVQHKGKAKAHPKKRPSEVNHGNIAPMIRDQGITAERITLSWAMPMAAVRRLRFGNPERTRAGQAYVAALGILARVLDHAGGYSLRSRCDLISAGPLSIDVIDADGAVTPHLMTTDDAVRLFNDAEVGLREIGLEPHRKVQAKPGGKLVDLIAVNRRHQELGDEQPE